MDEAPQDSRMPRGVLAVVAIGLLACVVAALLSTDKAGGDAANVEWVQSGPVPDSDPIGVPGGNESMQLVDGKIRATGSNDSDYSLFQIATVLKIDKGAPIGGGRIVCSVETTNNHTEIARSSNRLRTTYPRSSEGLYGQDVPETLLVDFSSHGVELAVLEVADLPGKYTTEKGVKLEWPKYKLGTEHLDYFLPEGKPKVDLELPFNTVWKAKGVVPAAEIACTLSTSAGSSTVETAGELKHLPPPINEDLEAEREEAREEKAEAEEG
jgi:hypothetical protein